jgi:hypothetical protein
MVTGQTAKREKTALDTAWQSLVNIPCHRLLLKSNKATAT